jgi:hypothetical protein
MLAIALERRVPLLWDLTQPGWQSVGCAAAARNLSCAEWRQARDAETYRKTCPQLPGPAACEEPSGPDMREKASRPPPTETPALLILLVPVFAALAAWVVARIYRRNLKAATQEAATGEEARKTAATGAPPPESAIGFELLGASTASKPSVVAERLYDDAQRSQARAAMLYAAAGALFATLATVIWLWVNELANLPLLRSLGVWVVFAWSLVPPVLLVAPASGWRRFSVFLAYFVTLSVLVGALESSGDRRAEDAAILWITLMLAPSLLWWAMGLGRLRPVGRLVLGVTMIGVSVFTVFAAGLAIDALGFLPGGGREWASLLAAVVAALSALWLLAWD